MPGTDFNGDGRDDMLLRDRDTDILGNWLATLGGGFTDNSSNSLIGVPSQWVVAATGDFDDDGNDDIAWYNIVDHRIGNWLGQDNGGWVINDKLLDLNVFTVTFAADFEGDGRDELLVIGNAGMGGPNALDVIFAYGDGDFDYSMGGYASIPTDWSVAGIGDFDGDGQDDILWRSADGTVGNWLTTDEFDSFGATSGAINDWLINDASLVHVGYDWQIVGVGDFDGDGHDDILWRHESGTVGNWLGGPGGLFTIDNGSLVQVPLNWQVADTGDYNGDGEHDILWRNLETGAIGTWLGTDTGLFSINPEPLVAIPTNWLIQPNPSGAGEWDY